MTGRTIFVKTVASIAAVCFIVLAGYQIQHDEKAWVLLDGALGALSLFAASVVTESPTDE